MLTIVCGEDSIQSRDYYNSLKKEYITKGYEIIYISPTEIYNSKSIISNSQSLFSVNQVFFVENLNKKLSKKLNPIFFSQIEDISIDKKNILISWEEFTASREIKPIKNSVVKEFKPSNSIFKLLDSCFPGNYKSFLVLLNNLPSKINDVFIFVMLIRHIRNLLLVRIDGSIKGMQSWQIAKLKTQSKYWKLDNLVLFYDNLHRIDLSIKSSKNPFSIKKSLDITAYYFL